MHNRDLKKAGLKVTGPRMKILHILETASAQTNAQTGAQNVGTQSVGTRHFSAEDIYKLLLETGDDIGLATVYRVLTQFEAAGIVIRHNFEGGLSVFELDDGKHHDHLVCIKCGKVQEFVDPTIEERQIVIAKKMKFRMTDHNLNIFGVCEECDI